MTDIATFKDQLEKRVPQGQVLSLQQDGQDVMIGILPPGVAVGDLRSFFSGLMEDIGDAWNILPESLPIDDLRLSSLFFNPATKEHPFQLECTLDWPSAHWEMIPGVLAIESPSITLHITGKADPYGHVDVDGDLSGVVEIEQLPIFIEVELPSGTFKAQLLKQGGSGTEATKPPSAGALMRAFQADGAQGGGVDLGSVTLQDLSVLGCVPARRLLLHLALGHISLGPGELATQLTIDYFGGANSQLSGMVWGQYDVHKKGTEDTLFSIMLAAAYDGPGKSWMFEGGAASAGSDAVTIKQLIEAFTDSGGIPGVLDELAIRYLHLAYETGACSFEFQCNVEVEDLFGADTAVEMIVDVRLQKSGAAYDKTFSGRLLFELENDLTLEFDLLFDQSPDGQASDTAFIAAYKNPSGGELDVGDLIRVIEPKLDVPLSISLQDAFFIYDKHGAQGGGAARSSSLFGLDIGGGIDLSALPLVGKIVAKDASLTFGLQPLVALGTPDPETTAYFSETDLARLGSLVPGGGITLPSQPVKEQIGLGIHVALGQDTSFHFDLPIKLNTKVQPKPASAPSPQPAQEAIETKTNGGQPPPSPPPSPATAAVTPPPGGSSASGIQWIKVGKSFGPVHCNRLGLQFEADKTMVWAYLDAGLSVGPLTFTLDGLGLGTRIDKLDPEFRLLGIGLDYQSGPLEIGASFLRTHVPAEDGQPAYDEYSGLATLKTPPIGLSAIGAYADLPKYKSLFIYAVLDAPIGGPVFFFLTGLAAGFGYNRAVKVPEVALVGRFPLVNLAVGGAGSPVPADPAGRSDYIHDILDRLRGSIYPMKGEYFVAAGIRFSSFELIDSFALLIVSFGEHFEVDVLGLSTLVVPTPVEGGEEVTPIAEVQLAIKVVFNPSEGILSVEAQLTSNSFILDRNCHLTGGFAFSCWFAGQHQGDFVVSLGGYHPDFQKPAHYPTVPRLGLDWQVSTDLSIKGGIYFALCAHAVMAGGGLQALYQSGAKKAWFTLAIDFLLCWKPYHYDARASLDVGVEYTYHLCGTHHIQVSISAGVHVWGPDFAGHAHLHLWCVTFDVDFGAKTTPKLEPLKWQAFRKSFLPAKKAKMVHVAVKDGLLRKEKVKAEEGVEQHVVNPRELHLGVDLVVPYKSLKIGDKDVPAIRKPRRVVVRGSEQAVAFVRQADGDYAQAAIGEAADAGAFGIAPMARGAAHVKSTLTLIVEKHVDGHWQAIEEDFGFRPVLKRVPRALWGETLKQDLNGERYVEDVPAGIELVPASPPKPGETQWIAKEKLRYTTAHVEPGIGFEPIAAFTAGDLGTAASPREYVKTHLTDPDTMKRRRKLLSALGFDHDRLGLELTPDVADALVMDPQVGRLVTS